MRRTGTIVAIAVVGLLLFQGYRTSKLTFQQKSADTRTAPAQANTISSDLLPAGTTTSSPSIPTNNPEDDAVASWLDEFTRNREATSKTEVPNAEEKQRLADYLIASSNIPFPQDPVFLREAFLENKDGKPAKLDQVIKGFEDGLATLKKLEPPERLTAIHEASVSQIADLVGVYKELRGETGKSLTEIWQAPTMAGLRERSSRTIAELRSLVSRYQLELPADVLPDYAL